MACADEQERKKIHRADRVIRNPVVGEKVNQQNYFFQNKSSMIQIKTQLQSFLMLG